MNKGFSGYYFKHQKNDSVLSVIMGQAADHSFVQVVTKKQAYQFHYPLEKEGMGHGFGSMRIGGNLFAAEGMSLCLEKKGITIQGELRYGSLTPVKYSIMGPFACLPIPCKHEIVSLRHPLAGKLRINENLLDFSGGIGYIEGDRGSSFPKWYTWIHCNAFSFPCSIVVSVADIPVLGGAFRGCICVVWMKGKEYRLATYLGVKVVESTRRELVLQQGKYRLEIQFQADSPQALLAPVQGKMTRIIHECVSCPAYFRFWEGEQLLLEEASESASVEFVE